VGGPSDDDVVAEYLSRDGHRKVVLPQVEHVWMGGVGEVGPVVDRQQPAVPVAGVTEDLEQRELFARLESLLPQLDDVHARGEDRVEEVGQVTAVAPTVGAQVEASVRKRGPGHAVSPRYDDRP
jgi:hypothetical protein